ncbi:uncharacterized protein N7443_007417 [Penicillium atrosanguineum]|uniref:HNH nuclease domain-containing protein n=1 Tax=Penicillium atrosanguineum TaxID=1132637 RepID=A0A9W9PNA7_9EURO|nr:uncharacterized protein N7443_007417 [Penicillium atrosanguineum]KAJ5296524.1 hypothetical protein N7443_007417 [Penicillium atrosanguineum]KAJ5299287.1 hypothetical protein N7476_010844 [Penicillium atrosanguineum]
MPTTSKMSLSGDTENIFSEFEDLERQDLIGRVLNNLELADRDSVGEIPRGTLFLLWFAADVLEDLAKPSSDARLIPLQQKVVTSLPLDITSFLVFSKKNPFANTRGTKCKSSQASATTSPTKRDPKIVEKVGLSGSLSLDRDREQCLVTMRCAPTLESAHIIPNRFCGTFVRPCRSEFWNHLRTYWGRTQTEKWEAELLQGSYTINTEFTANMMTLSKQVHAYWGCPMCAFRPVSVNEAQTMMHIALHWLPMLPPSVKRSDYVSSTENPFSGGTQELTTLPTARIGFYNWERKVEMQSGDIFTVTTDDPLNRPLPSWVLLLLMWHLTRIAAMQGAGEDSDDDLPSDEDVDPIPSGTKTTVTGKRQVSRGRSPAVPRIGSRGGVPTAKWSSSVGFYPGSVPFRLQAKSTNPQGRSPYTE